MAESTDKQTRKIAEKRVEKGKEFESYQEAQNQLLAIQAEQKQNLALQANEAATMSAQNQTLGQAAEIMAIDEPTRNILSGYGLNQPRVIKNSNVQRQGPNNITINNTTINNTSGPVQGREISIRPPQETNQGRFKAWLTNVFARQDAEWQKRNQEYIRRESSLTRNANKMMRKIEGLGKEIGNAVDPRKASQRASNSTMNLLKALGLLYFAKKLPSILEFFNDAEGKIRGWISDIGDKIKEGLGGGDGKTGFLVNLKDSLWNDDETGALNRLVKWLSQELYNRKQLADSAIAGLDWGLIKTPGEAIKEALGWLSAFFGGEKAAKSIINKGKEMDILESMNLKEVAGNRIGKNVIDAEGSKINIAGATGIELDNDRTNVNYLYSRWARKEGLSEREMKKWKNKNRFLEEEGKNFLTYFGEADILTKRLHSDNIYIQVGYENGLNGTTLTKKDFNLIGNKLASDNRRATLAASLDLYKQLKGRITTNTRTITPGLGGKPAKESISSNTSRAMNVERVIYLLKLLSEKSTVVVFKKFVDLFKSLETTDDAKVKVKLVREEMEERDRQFYWPKNTSGYSTYYQKIVLSTVNGKPRRLKEEDFNGYRDQDEWEMVKLSGSTIQNLLTSLTENSVVDYTSDTQKKVIKNLKGLGVIDSQKEADSYSHIIVDKNYNTSISKLNEAIREKEEYRNERHPANYSANEKNSFSSSNYSTLDENGKLITKKITREEKELNSRKVFDALKKEGFTDEQAAGISGVLRHESAGFNPAAINAKEFKDGLTGYGEGLAQWSNERKKTFESWWKRKNVGKDFPGIHKLPIEDQIEFLLHEFKQRRVYNDIKSLSESNGLSKEDIIKQSADLFTRGFENGSTSGYSSIEAMENTYRNKHKHWKSYEETILAPRLNYASGIYNSYVGRLTPTISSQRTRISRPTTNPRNPSNQVNTASSVTGNKTIYRPTGTTGFAPELDFSEVFEPTITTENPDNYMTTPRSSSSPTRTLAESITPVDKSQDNNSNPFGSQEGFDKFSGQMDYLCMGVEALVNNSADGFNMMASAYKQGNQPRNLTPGVSPLEDNIT